MSEFRPPQMPALDGRLVRTRQEEERPTPLRRIIVKPAVTVGTSNVTLYTVPSGVFYNIKHFTATDITAGAVKVTVWIVPDGQSTADQYLAYDEHSISAGVTEVLDGLVGDMLEPGDQVIAVTDTVAGANFRLWGETVEGQW